jgi:4-amino-4-deoxy-L-arabinose transferase-like glycosyltransferase
MAAAAFIPFLGGVHLFDWDEINFAEISREMIVLNEYLRIHIDFQPFWEKPPLFFWMQAASMHLFGIGEFAARFPNALCGILTLLLLYRIGSRLYDHTFGLLWAGAYFGSILPHLYFRSGIIDPWFNLFIFLGLYLFILSRWKKEDFAGINLRRKPVHYLFWGGMILGAAMLTKGQVAYLIVALTILVYGLIHRFRRFVNVPEFLLFTLAASCVTLCWFGVETLRHGPWFVTRFTQYQYRLFSTPDAGHGGFPGYHFAVLLIGCFPASIFAIRSFWRIPAKYAFQRDFSVWMMILLWVVLILFTIVKSKVIHYSSLCYFPLSFLAATVTYALAKGEIKLNGWMKGGLIVIGSLFSLAVIIAPLFAKRLDILEPFLQDPFAKANLEAQVHWTGFEILPGLILFPLLIMAVMWMARRRVLRGLILLYGGTALFVFLTLVFFVKRVEGYSQRAAIEFFESKAEEDCYVGIFGYRTFAHLFYTQKQPPEDPAYLDPFRIFQDPVDKPVYLVTKIHKAADLERMGGMEEIGRRNGFVMYRRTVQPEKRN